MAVFSKIISLAVLLTAAAVTTEASLERPLARAVNVRRHPAKALHVSPVEDSALVKRAPRKKRCTPKTTSSTTTKAASTTKATSKAVTTTTTKAAESKPDTSGNNSKGKAGLAWNDNGKADPAIFTGSGSRVSWCYTWSPWPCEDNSIESVLMLWGSKQVGQFGTNFNKYKPDYVLSFNEPDRYDQADLSPADAVSLWYQELDWRDTKLIAPGVSGGPDGRKWLTDFMKRCSGCKIHALGIHYYSTDADALIAYVKDVYEEFKMKIWVTEWACHTFPNNKCSPSEAMDFNVKVMRFFESTWYIERYSAFGSLTNMYNVGEGARLMTSGGKLTDLGAAYAYGGL